MAAFDRSARLALQAMLAGIFGVALASSAMAQVPGWPSGSAAPQADASSAGDIYGAPPAAAAVEAPRNASEERVISVGGLKREFILHLPKNAAPGPWPLVIALHGAWQPASVFRSYLDLDEIADREGFAVAYPRGLNLLWNDGRGSVAGIMPIIQKRDDAAFILAVLDALAAEAIADPNRSYLMGFSNGAFLTAFIACRHAERFAAYATMMMTAPVSYAETCRPARPIPILMMNGSYDPIVPTFGRPTPGAKLMSATESAELFARIDGCGTPQAAAGPSARILRWDDCAQGSAVHFYEIEGGHQPPARTVGPMDALAGLVLGPRRKGLDAPEEIWAFFRRYGTVPSAIAGPVEPAATAIHGGLPAVATLPGGPTAAPSAQHLPVANVPRPIPSPVRQRTISTQ
ncbi:PHB depolymerase family esterase [Bosea sp. 117]|uniref:alpha/beta hydrolase family esterase n=1 Tax=Bosea sp. 117 TaxID=1125973 RepID=UPI0020C006B5|nr:PHB depolymerase family esterase [Bosea sp. 117]